MPKVFNFGDMKVTLSPSGKYAEFGNGRIVPVRYRGQDRYIIRVITTEKGCPRGVEKLFLDRME